MATCMICGNKIGPMEGETPLSPEHSNIKICKRCRGEKYILTSNYDNVDGTGFASARKYFMDFISNNKLASKEATEPLLEFIKRMDEKRDAAVIPQYEEIARNAESVRIAQEKNDSFVIATTSVLDGYRIVKYIGFVCEEVVLGTGFLSELSASAADFLGVSRSEEPHV